MEIYRAALRRGRRVTEEAVWLSRKTWQYLVRLNGKSPLPNDWLERLTRASAEATLAAARYQQDQVYRQQGIHRILGRAGLNQHVSNLYVHESGEATVISIYPKDGQALPAPTLMIRLIGAFDLTVDKWDTEPYSAYTNRVDITVKGRCPGLGEMKITLRAVDGGPSCRVIERTRVIPGVEETYLAVECTDPMMTAEVPHD